MPDDFISRNEFNGFTRTVQDGFGRVHDNLTQVLTKIDTLVNGRVEEARVMGQLTEAVRAIGERQRQQELSIESLRKSQEEQDIRVREEFNTLWDKEQAKSEASIKWWWRAALYALVAFMGAFINKFFALIRR